VQQERRQEQNQQQQQERVQQERRQEQNQQQQQERVSQQRQQELIEQQQQRLAQYRQHLNEEQRLAQQQTALLQQQRRIAQYRFQQQYWEHVRQEQSEAERYRNWNDDPYFYTPPIYRYRYRGTYYEANQYGADLLRRAVNYGYEEGFRAGEADREDRWRPDYQHCYAYQDANYGYPGYYLDQDEYNYYFREGFRRGYEDGYYSRYQYGSYVNGSYSMLGAVLSQILSFQSLR